MSIRKLFEFIEHTINQKIIAKQQMQYAETANASVSSPNFVDPADKVESESKRLEGEPVVKNYEEVF